MSTGYTGTILRIDLSTGDTTRLNPDDDFYRTYMGGSAIGSYYIFKETDAATDPLAPGNMIVIAPGVTTGAAVCGASRCSVTSLSPLTGTIGDSQAGGSIGPLIKHAGYDAVLISGRAENPSYIFIEDNNVTIKDASQLSGKTVSSVLDILEEQYGKKNCSIIQCGPAGEKMVRFANIMAGRNDSFGRAGLGAVWGSKNLRALVVKSDNKTSFADNNRLKQFNKTAAEKLTEDGFPATLKRYGTPGIVASQAKAGNFATHNYSRSIHEEYMQLDGSQYPSSMDAGKATCPGCIIACRKKVKADTPYPVTDKLGGPEFETLSLLGSNLDITDPTAVAHANELCNEYGVDTITMGCVAGYIFEGMEKGIISPDSFDGKMFHFGDPEGLFRLIELTCERSGIGNILAEGFEDMIKEFGKETKSFAIEVKGEGLPAHMPQVKPSQALMYAACPIGPDHMSSEHDWLHASGSEESKGLGILGEGDAASTCTGKVRMTVYSQYYFSLLDSLCLCMFCWGPGNLFNYDDIVNLVRFATGWEVSFFELMKAGERRVNLMRQINARRGFTREQDILPERLFKPLPDGPGKGRHVESKAFGVMLQHYYQFMGWDIQSGNPLPGKLIELGLEWTM